MRIRGALTVYELLKTATANEVKTVLVHGFDESAPVQWADYEMKAPTSGKWVIDV